jgi:hypothetical protein
MQGWTRDGIETFNKLCQEVVADRASADGKQFEIDFKAFQKVEALRRKTKLDVDGDSGSESDDDGEQEKDQNTQRYVFNHLQDLEKATCCDDNPGVGEDKVSSAFYDSDDNVVQQIKT